MMMPRLCRTSDGSRATGRAILLALMVSVAWKVSTHVGASAFAGGFGRPNSREVAMQATASQERAVFRLPNLPSIRDPLTLLADAQRLFQDIASVVSSTGIEIGATRTIQAATAISRLLTELIQEPPSALDETFVAVQIRKLFEKLGPAYVKIGQFIASSPTVFPAVYVREFQQCLDSTGTISFAEIKRIVEDEIGPIDNTFHSFDEVALASASIAQVHGARLLTGEDVVVKVQKPSIENTLTMDLNFVFISARILEFINPDLNKRGSLADIAQDLRTSMLGELDFRTEADNLITFRTFLRDNSLEAVATAPAPFIGQSSKRVLVMERLRGVPLADIDSIQEYTNNPEATLVAALNVWVTSVKNCAFFHADVHAGNLFVLDGGRVGFLDFGIVGRIPDKMSVAIDEMTFALNLGDSLGMARALISMGATVGQVDEESFADDIGNLLDRLKKSDSGVSEAQIQDIVLDIAQTAGNNGLKLPREFGLLIKQALYFDRYTKLLAPDLDMMSDDRIARFGGPMRGSSMSV